MVSQLCLSSPWPSNVVTSSSRSAKAGGGGGLRFVCGQMGSLQARQGVMRWGPRQLKDQGIRMASRAGCEQCRAACWDRGLAVRKSQLG